MKQERLPQSLVSEAYLFPLGEDRGHPDFLALTFPGSISHKGLSYGPE